MAQSAAQIRIWLDRYLVVLLRGQALTVLWDNRFTLHYPINDFSRQRRLLLRCTALES